MHWALSIVLLIMLLFIYRLDGYNIATPSFITTTVFLISSIVFSINAKKWDIELSFYTVFLIVTAILLFYIGSRVKISIKLRHENLYSDINSVKRTSSYIYRIPVWIVCVIFVFNCMATFLMYRRLMQIAVSQVTEYFLMNARVALSTDETWGTAISVLRECSYGLGYICLFVFIVNITACGKKEFSKNLYLLLPVIPMVISMFLSTGRTGFIRVLGMAFIVWIAIYSQAKKIRLGKFVAIGVGVFAVLLFIFYQTGKATGKSYIFGIFDSFSIYIGSSIGGLNEYLKDPVSYSNVVAGETLYGIRDLLSMVIPDIETAPIALPFTYVKGGYNTNVYTALRRYINDFGIGGMFVLMFLKGLLFGNWGRLIIKKRDRGLSLLLYAYFMYDIFMQSIEENLLRELLTIAQVFILFVFFFGYKFLIKPYRQSCPVSHGRKTKG